MKREWEMSVRMRSPFVSTYTVLADIHLVEGGGGQLRVLASLPVADTQSASR